MRKDRTKEEKLVGFGYVARWSDGTLGWVLPGSLTGYARERSWPRRESRLMGEPLVLCRITLEVVKGKNGKPITRLGK